MAEQVRILQWVDMFNWVFECFCSSLDFCKFLLHFGTFLSAAWICTLKLICSYMSQIGKEVRGIELGGCSYFILHGLLRENGRWQLFSAWFCTFPYLLYVAFWFKVLLHAVSHYNSYINFGSRLCWCKQALNTESDSLALIDNNQCNYTKDASSLLWNARLLNHKNTLYYSVTQIIKEISSVDYF